jgi:RNA polymerase sigma factor for flagellar operon FliA
MLCAYNDTDNEPSPINPPVGPSASESRNNLTAIREQLVLEHLPIVRLIARRIHGRLPQHVLIEDLYSAGIVGLLDAISKFNPSSRSKFRSYAQYRIRGAILDSLRLLDWAPRKLRSKGRDVQRARQTLTTQLGRSPNELEVARELNIELPSYQQLLGELKGLEIRTLHSERSESSGRDELANLPTRPEEDPLFLYLHAEMSERLAAAIEDLPDRERLVVTLYYYEEATMAEIGAILGILEPRVSQIRASAVLHLRARLTVSRTGSGRATQVRSLTKKSTLWKSCAKNSELSDAHDYLREHTRSGLTNSDIN